MLKFLLRIDFERLLSFGYKSKYPQRQLIVGYAAYSIIGTLLLMLPISLNRPISPIDNLFTAVSALSTTGLSTVDVANDYTFLGQLIILLLIQLGGLGYMTISSYIMIKLTNHMGTQKAKLFNAQFTLPDTMDAKSMIRNIINFTIGFEILGIILLYPYFLFNDISHPLWSAIFHSISAFCTAGFSIYSDNLMQFQSDYYVNIVIIILSYMGAMGFILITDLFQKILHRKYKISFTTKVIIIITCLLSLWGTIHLYFFEPSIEQFPKDKQLLISLFQSMSAMTTVGYNTIDLGTISTISLLILSVSMYIGASPSGTGGGLKSTTLSALFAYTKNKLSLQKHISLFGNKIPEYRIDTALTTFIFYTFILFIGIYLIALFEPSDTQFLKIVFEASSALATTGLSSGILSTVTVESKIVLIFLMFIGRVGVITLGNVMLMRSLNKYTESKNDDLAI